MTRILIDADACPVKQEVYRVATRYDLEVILVANSWMRIPEGPRHALVVVEGDFDAADDWIVEHVKEEDIVVTGDILLASRCLKKRARVLGHSGRPFTEHGIGDAVATKELLSQLRAAGTQSGGPAALEPRDRSRFLQSLDEMVLAARRREGS